MHTPARDLASNPLDAVPDALLAVDRSGHIVLANRHAGRLFGYEVAELVGRHLDLLLPMASRAAHGGHLARFFEAPTERAMGLGLTLYALARDGREIPVDVALGYLGEGVDQLAIASVRDLTARHRLENELARSRDILAMALESLDRAPAGMAWLDSSLRIVRVNAGWRDFARANGANEATELGVGLDYRAYCTRELGLALDDLLAGTRTEVAFTYSCHAPHELRWIAFEARRLQDGVLVIHVDRTHTHQLAARTALQDLLSRGLAARQPLGELFRGLLARLGNDLDWDAARAWSVEGGQVGAVLSRWHAEGLAEPDEAQARELVARVIADALTERPHHYYAISVEDHDAAAAVSMPTGLFVPLIDGGEVLFVLELRSRRTRPEDEAWVEFLEMLGRQICAQVRAEQLRTQIAQAERLAAIGSLAAGVAHEINNPLQYLGSSLEFLRETSTEVFQHLRHLSELVTWARAQPADPALAAVLDKIAESAEGTDIAYLETAVPAAFVRAQSAVDRVAVIVRALKRFAHRQVDRAFAASDISRAVEDAVTIAQSEWRIVADFGVAVAPLPLVECDLGEIGQVVLNLVINAAQAIAERVEGGSPRGRVDVRAWAEEQHVAISVSDDAGGIPDAIQHRIFEPFFTTKPVGVGSGQGLAMAWHMVVEDHRGELSFETEAGVGTTFLVRLPIHHRQSGPDEA
jgi:PAS domain S-box-containing protein